MHWLLYLRLVLLTAGTLLPFFWMMVILGHRRQRNFERVFFFLCLALTCFCGSSLLELNAELYYGTQPHGLLIFTWTFLCFGLWFIPPLVVHLHVEYASLRELLADRSAKRLWLFASYLPAILLSGHLFRALRLNGYDFEAPSHLLGVVFQLWLFAAVVVAAHWQWRFMKASPDYEQRSFHKYLCWDFVFLLFWLFCLILGQLKFGPAWLHSGIAEQIILWAIVLPLADLIREVQRFNFLQIGRQRNLIYAVFLTFVALLYLSFVRRASLWLDSTLPPEATAALLLFLPVVFFEPLQRAMRRLLQQTAQTEVDRAQRLVGPVNEVARLGNIENLRTFCERWIGEQLQMAEVQLSLEDAPKPANETTSQHSGAEETFAVQRSGRRIGTLRVRAHGAMISGETYAALEFVCEQLPAAFDLCRLLEEKLELERELAERERLALVGQTAASISHNLKNPLGSIKTILQVQLESDELPDSMRAETKMILGEINRLSSKLNQLLQFSRPALLDHKSEAQCDIREVIADVLNVLRPEAERRHVRLGWRMPDVESKVDASSEALHDVISNLVVNAIDASPRESEVRVQLSWQSLPCVVSVEDEGNGIPPNLQERVLQPFFTTKADGTGLGLAIVVKRVAELGGELKIVSPLKEGRGTRFEVKLWPAVMRRGSAGVEKHVQES